MNRSRMLQSLISSAFPYPTDGLVSYWKLDEDPAIHNTVIEDSIGSNNGTLITDNGSTNKSVVGKIDRAIRLDGVDDYIDMGNVFPANNFTISAWIETSYLAGDTMSLFGVGTSTGSSVLLYPSTTFGSAKNQIRLYALDSEVLIGSDIRNTGWRHISLVRSGDDFTLYLDSVVDGVGTALGTPGTLLYFGNWPRTDRYLSGAIDDLLLYNQTLTQAEIQQIYNFGA